MATDLRSTLSGQLLRLFGISLLMVDASCCTALSGGVELHVRVGGAVGVGETRVWLQPSDGPGMRLTGALPDHFIELDRGREYLLAYERDGCVPEVLYVDARLPEGGSWRPQPPLEVWIRLEAEGDLGFDYLEPTGTILFRADINAFGFADAAHAEFPWPIMERLNRLTAEEHPRILAVRSPNMDCGDPDAPHWLGPTFEPCERSAAVYELRDAGVEGGLHLATIHSLDGALRARASYEDACHRTPHGTFIFYHANGNVGSTGEYVHGYRSGPWSRYTTDGQPMSEKYYEPGVLADILGRQRFANAQEASLSADRFGTLASVVGRTPPSVHVIRYRTAPTEPPPDGVVVDRPLEPPAVHGSRARVRQVPVQATRSQGRKEELVVDRLNVTVIVRVDEGSVPVEYRRVVNYYGPVYYFRNGESCTAERFAHATGR